MKVILLAPTPPPSGGIASWTVRMENASLKNGWKVKVVDEKLSGNREVFGVNTKRILFMEIKRCIRIWKNLKKALTENEVKIVHSCIPASTTGMLREYVCALISKARKRKFIIHYRCTIPNMCKSRIGMLIFRLLSNKSDLVMVLNTQSVDFVKKHSSTSVVLIPNFIEEAAIIDEHTKVISDKVKRVLYVGGVIKTKGCGDIITVAKEFPDIEFRLVGNPATDISKLPHTSNVIFCGEKSKAEVKREFLNADLFMFVTHFPGEGFSNALAEAMASGIPCITTDWAANKDMIEEKGGIVVSIKDTVAMKNAVSTLKENRELRQNQSTWNINKVKTCYSEKVVTGMYVDEYEKTIK